MSGIIANVIRDSAAFNDVSLRDIGNRRRSKSKKEKVLWGLMGFPDFVLIDTKYQPASNNVDRQYLYGAIEVKFVGKSLDKSIHDKKQLWGHLLWFQKVIYTNGIEWRFYRIKKEYIENILKEFTSKSLNELQDDSYNKLAKKGIVYQEINDILDSIYKSYVVNDVTEHEFFVLRSISEDEKKMWNETEWTRLTKYLDKYSVR